MDALRAGIIYFYVNCKRADGWRIGEKNPVSYPQKINNWQTSGCYNVTMDLNSNLGNIKATAATTLFGETVETKLLSIKDRLGFIPISVWRPDWSITKEWKALIADDGSTRELVGNEMALPGSKYKTSIFNPHLAMMILSAYCPQNARIFDAFAGGGTRAIVAASMGFDYLGVELRGEEVDRIRERGEYLGKKFEIVCGDSTKYEPEPEAFDFSYSCPPYYDLEVYSKLEGDISNASDYGACLDMLHASLNKTNIALKPGSLCVWVVGNFRDKNGYLRHFNGDVINCARNAGFVLHDELIWWGASGAAHQRAGQFEANRKSVRVHEYIIVLKKP